MWTVYMATNKINGKRYVGITHRGLAHRRGGHLSRAKRGDRGCPRFYDAIRKYGPQSFEWQAIASFEDKAGAQDAEIALIAKIRKKSEEYNVARGGDVGVLVPVNRRPVVCLEDGIVYESATSAARAYNSDVSDICKVCSGAWAHNLGLHFRFVDQFHDLSEEGRRDEIIRAETERATARRRSPIRAKLPWQVIVGGKDRIGRSAAGPMKNRKKVICLDDLALFDSVTEAAMRYDIHHSSISQVCRGSKYREKAGGLRFCYLDEWCPNPA